MSPSHQHKLICYIFIANFILPVNLLQTCELHLQPLPHSINSTLFVTQRSTVLCNFNNFNSFITLANAISLLTEGGAEATKQYRSFAATGVTTQNV